MGVVSAERSLPVSAEETLVWVLLDRSASMESIRDDTIKGYNRFVRRQTYTPGAHVSLTQFDDEGIDDLYTDLPAERVPPLTRDTFHRGARLRSTTPLAPPSIACGRSDRRAE